MNYSTSFEYTANLYRGCTHGCVYCYAPSLIYDDRSWGTFVDAKINAPKVLEKELRRAEKHMVFLSSASDPYQPVEARYRLTRQVLEVLVKHEFPVLILTRSSLVLRDLDLLKRLPWVRVGFSIYTVHDSQYEPGVPPLTTRIRALRRLSNEGITTWVSMAPIIPQLVLTDIERLFSRLEESRVSTVVIGLLRFEGYRESKEMFERFTGRASSEMFQGSKEVLEQIISTAQHHGIDTSGACLSFNEEPTSTLDKFTK